MTRSRRLLPCFTFSLLFLAVTSSAAPSVDVLDAYGRLPLRFERNLGQTAAEVEYLSRGRGSTLFLTRTEAVLALRDGHGRDARSAVLRLRMIGASAAPVIAGEEPLPGTTNYFVGNDRSRWRSGVPSYRRVRYDDVWPGIDLLWHGAQHALEYDFVVAPGVDPSRIAVQVDGASALRIDRAGNLVATTAAGDVVQRAPVLYQDGPSGRTPVSGGYVLRGRKRVGFAVGPYDTTRTLVIDPILEYSTFLGGSFDDDAFGIAVDRQGNAYVTGPTLSLDFPRSRSLNGETSAVYFVARLNAEGTDLLYSTFIGTNEIFGPEVGDGVETLISTGIAVTADGKACITGAVNNVHNKSDYPVTDNAFQKGGFCLGFCDIWRDSRGIDAFVTVLSPDGESLVYSTFYGGNDVSALASFDRGEAIAVDDVGRVYVAGVTNSDDLPMKNAFQPSRTTFGGTEAFVAVFDPSEERGDDTLRYASFLGGSEDDRALGIAVDLDRNAYVAGWTASRDLRTKAPGTRPPLQAGFQGGTSDGFVAKVDTESLDAASLEYLTYFGGDRDDRVEAVAVDPFHQRAFITGATTSGAGTFPLLNAFDAVQQNGEAFVAKLGSNGTSLFYSSYIGGANNATPDDFEEGTGIAVDDALNVYVTGNSSAGDTFSSTAAEARFPPSLRGTVFVTKIRTTSSATAVPPLVYSTTFGGVQSRARGIAVDANGSAYITGFTGGGLPVTGAAFQSASGGERDAFVAKVSSNVIRIGEDSTALYDDARNEFHLRNANTTGPADVTIPLGEPGDLPVAGDWDGDGVTDVGVFHPPSGEFVLRLGSGAIARVRSTAVTGDLPVAGDWDGDGFDTPGYFRTGARVGASFLLTNERVEDATSPAFDIFVPAGQRGDLPLAGDWNGDGADTLALYRPSTSTFLQIDDFAAGVARSFVFGAPGDLPIAGDWDANGTDDVALFRPTDRTMRLSTDLGLTEAFVFELQAPGETPLAGNWDGR